MRRRAVPYWPSWKPVILAEIEQKGTLAGAAARRVGRSRCCRSMFLKNTNEQGSTVLMTQDQLNEIWRRHTAGEEVGRGIVCTTDEEGAESKLLHF